MKISYKSMVTLLQVHSMKRSISFYCDILGFSVSMHSPLLNNGSYHWCLLKRESFEIMLNTMHEEIDTPIEDEVRKKHHSDIGIFVYTDDVDTMHQVLIQNGLNVNKPIDVAYGMRQLYVTDPDGYSWCFQKKLA